MHSLRLLVRVGLEPQGYIASTSALACSAVKRLEQVGNSNALTSVITLP